LARCGRRPARLNCSHPRRISSLSSFRGAKMKYGMALMAVMFVWTPAIIAEDSKTELEGKWVVIRLERQGKELKAQKDMTAAITGNKFSVTSGDKVVVAGTFKLDTSKKPWADDMTYTEGPDKGKTFKGISKLEGDVVTFCRPTSPDGERPTEFKTS